MLFRSPPGFSSLNAQSPGLTLCLSGSGGEFPSSRGWDSASCYPVNEMSAVYERHWFIKKIVAGPPPLGARGGPVQHPRAFWSHFFFKKIEI